jgi:hypothetical protein
VFELNFNTWQANITHGFYYSLTDNFYLNIAHHAAHAATPLPGQVDVNQTEFETIALGQVGEIWSNYGQLGEIWFDGGYVESIHPPPSSLHLWPCARIAR